MKLLHDTFSDYEKDKLVLDGEAFAVPSAGASASPTNAMAATAWGRLGSIIDLLLKPHDSNNTEPMVEEPIA